jgi:nucleoside-triphosphatase THEP1
MIEPDNFIKEVVGSKVVVVGGSFGGLVRSGFRRRGFQLVVVGKSEQQRVEQLNSKCTKVGRFLSSQSII